MSAQIPDSADYAYEKDQQRFEREDDEDYCDPNLLLCSHLVPAYDRSDVKMVPCGEPGVHGTEGCYCPKHGIESEMWMLDKDATETRPEYKMTAEERFFSVMQIAKYDLALVHDELGVV